MPLESQWESIPISLWSKIIAEKVTPGIATLYTREIARHIGRRAHLRQVACADERRAAGKGLHGLFTASSPIAEGLRWFDTQNCRRLT
jgi:hypothetical protein